MTDTDDTIPREAVELLAALMTANAEHLVGLYQDMLIGEKARLDMTRDLLTRALNHSVWGGTTAQYEATLSMCREALYPPYGLLDHYLARARKYVMGEDGWDEPIINTDGPGGLA